MIPSLSDLDALSSRLHGRIDDVRVAYQRAFETVTKRVDAIEQNVAAHRTALDSRITALDEKVDDACNQGDIDEAALDAKLSGRIDGLNKKIDAAIDVGQYHREKLNKKLDYVSKTLDNHMSGEREVSLNHARRLYALEQRSVPPTAAAVSSLTVNGRTINFPVRAVAASPTPVYDCNGRFLFRADNFSDASFVVELLNKLAGVS